MTADIPNNIGARIRARRIELELSQEKLGELSGYLQCQVSGWERGANEPRMKAIRALCGALKCDPTWLAFGTEPETDNEPDDGSGQEQDLDADRDTYLHNSSKGNR